MYILYIQHSHHHQLLARNHHFHHQPLDDDVRKETDPSWIFISIVLSLCLFAFYHSPANNISSIPIDGIWNF